ncbi:MAG: carbohydrate kinase [Caldilineaceae bacterium SB0664_bin_22]|nr:carbohydrate kinase [Caldilineaceae bacterium SB0664_bin_22]MYC64242.1 carbohydrate kinase [Caldilineaceae bacterium SB0661_bin_34]
MALKPGDDFDAFRQDHGSVTVDKILAGRVLAIGYACWDLTFTVDHHFGPDEKGTARDLAQCGGGLAANAAAASGRLGFDTWLASYLGRDMFGDAHAAELEAHGVHTDLLLRGAVPTSISAIMVKPDGRRALVNHKLPQPSIAPDAISLADLQPDCVLVDGRQLPVAHQVLDQAAQLGIPSMIDADSASRDILELAVRVDHVVGSERYATELAGLADPAAAVVRLANDRQTLVVTCGDKGLLWARDGAFGSMPAHQVEVLDTNGAGDAFHGAYAGALAAGLPWLETLRFASATAALCCGTVGSRNGLPRQDAVHALMQEQPLESQPIARTRP